MLIRYSEVYANTEILSPIDRETWQIIGELCKVNSHSRVLELASGKGAFAFYLAQKYGCLIDCYDRDEEFIDYSNKRAQELHLSAQIKFTHKRVQDIQIEAAAYDVGVCLGALYIFREAGLKVFLTGVKPNGYLAISDLYCKKPHPPQELIDVFFEEEEGPQSLGEVRQQYMKRGFRILREVDCSWSAWLNYYDLTKIMLQSIAQLSDPESQREAVKELREDRLVRTAGKDYLGYMTFIMQNPLDPTLTGGSQIAGLI